jgi:hypothetical protein
MPDSYTLVGIIPGIVVDFLFAITPITISEAQGVRPVQVVIVVERTPG